MKRKLAILAPLSLLLALIMALSGCESAPAQDEPAAGPVSARSAQEEYRLAKLNDISDMVLARQMISEDYLRYVDGDTAEAVKSYNAALASAKNVATQYAKDWAESIRNSADLSPEDEGYDALFAGYGRYLKEGDNYFRFIDEFSTALLYPNHTDFTLMGTVVGYPAGMEGGGSGGLWATGYYLGEDGHRILDDLSTASSGLLDRLDAARAGLDG